MKAYLIASCLLIIIAGSLLLEDHKALAVPVSYNQTAISIPWTVQARNSTVTDLFTNNDTHLLNMQFENNLVDNSNYYNNATWIGSSSFVTGKWGSFAANFTGSNYIKIVNNMGFYPLSTITVSAWVTDLNTGLLNPRIISNLAGDFTGWEIFMNGATAAVQLYSNGGLHVCNIGTIGSTFEQVGFTFDGTNIKTYLNGVLINTCNEPGNIIYDSPPPQTLIGANPANYGVKFQGSIDDIHIFNRVLSQAEITADFNTGIYPTKPTLITNWYHYTSTASRIGLKLGTNTNNLVLACTPYSTSLAIQGENILYDCTKSGSTTRQINTDSINTFSGSSSVLFHSNGCQSNDQDFSTFIFPTATYVHSFCFGGSSTAGANNATATTISGNNTIYSGLNNPISPTISNGYIFLSSQKFALSSVFASNTFLRFNSNTTSTNDPNISLFTTDLCDMSSMPGYTLRQISTIGCDPEVSANQIHYLNGTQMLQVNNYYSNNTLPFFSSIQDNQYKSALTLIPNILGITAPYTDFILYTPTANYMVVLTGTPLSGNIYYINVNTITGLLAKNYAYQSYMMTTQSTTSSFGIVNTNMGQTVRLYGPSNLNTTTNIGGLFTVTSPYQIQAFTSSTSNGQTRIIDPQWTNVPATNYPIIWTSPQLLYPVYLTVSNAPTDAGLLVVNNNVSINNTQQTWAVIRLDSTHSGEYDVPEGTCQDLYVSDISQKPPIYTFQGSTCATGVNQKTVAYTNSLPLNFYNFPYGATDSFVPSTNTLTTTVRATTVPFTYTETITNRSGTILSTQTFNASASPDTQTFNVSANGQPLLLKVSAGGNQIFSDYLGSSFSLASTASFFHQYFNYQGFDLLSFIPLVFASMFTGRTSAVGVILVVVVIASLNFFSVVTIPSQYIFISALVGTIALIAGRQIYG